MQPWYQWEGVKKCQWGNYKVFIAKPLLHSHELLPNKLFDSRSPSLRNVDDGGERKMGKGKRWKWWKYWQLMSMQINRLQHQPPVPKTPGIISIFRVRRQKVLVLSHHWNSQKLSPSLKPKNLISLHSGWFRVVYDFLFIQYSITLHT